MADNSSMVPALLRQAAEAHGDAVAHATADGAQLTYAEWRECSDRFARGLLLLGADPGSHIVLDFGAADWVNVAIAYVGSQRADAVPVVLLPGLDDRSVLRAVVSSRAIAIVGAPREALHRHCYRWTFDAVMVAGAMDIPLPAVDTSQPIRPLPGVGQRAEPSTVLHALPFGSEPGQSLLVDPLSRPSPVTVVAALDCDAARFLGLIDSRVDAVVLTSAMAEALLDAAQPGAVRDSVRSVTVAADRCRPRLLDGLRSLFPDADVAAGGGVGDELTEIEDVIMDHPNVAEVGVVMVPNSVDVEELWAAVVARRAVDGRALLDDLERALGPVRTPRVIQMVDGLPRDALGGLVREKLRRTVVGADGLAITRLGGIAVHFRQQFEGGGQSFGQAMLPYVERRFGRVPRLLEWCSGPGFIGFALLGRGLCEYLGLSDVNPGVVELCQTTIERNGLASRVSTYVSDCFDAMPPEPGWDLVVANPPHWLTHAAVRADARSQADPDAAGGTGKVRRAERSPLIYLDPMWRTHRKFFAQLPSHLAEGGSAVLMEHSVGSSAEDFEDMIRDSGLTIVDVEPAEGGRFYFLHVRRA
jgi:hypothetical protein